MTLKEQNNLINCFFKHQVCVGDSNSKKPAGCLSIHPKVQQLGCLVPRSLLLFGQVLLPASCIQFTFLVFIATTLIIRSNTGRLNTVRKLLNKATTERATCSFVSVLGRKERAVLCLGVGTYCIGYSGETLPSLNKFSCILCRDSLHQNLFREKSKGKPAQLHVFFLI